MMKWVLKNKNRKGQVTIFIILAIVIVAAVGIYFLVRSGVSSERIPAEFQSEYEEFVTCIEDILISGVKTLESKGGYIDLPDFESGSEFMPFSSQLNFLGTSVPYWYYVSGNNIEREQVPSLSFMENELENFIDDSVVNCIPENLEEGYTLNVGEPSSKVNINSNDVQLNVKMEFDLSKEDSSVSVKNHRVTLETELGNLYDNARKVYSVEQKELFLENYSLDILRLNAPVDGVEISCAPKIWLADEIFIDLENAIDDNIASLKTNGDAEDYFLVDSLNGKLSNDVYVKFLSFKNWPKTFEVNPSDGPVLISNPVGNQEGLGILGFCYVPYHYVYDVKFPIMVQVYSEVTDEIFQFPLAIIIEDNVARTPKQGTAEVYENSQICESKNTEFFVRTVDDNFNNVESEIYFDCFSSSCYLGKAENGVFEGLVPQCVNGNFVVKSEGFEDTEISTSTVNSGSIEIVLDKKYEMKILLRLDSGNYNNEALITFENSEGDSQTVVYPDQNIVELVEGDYKVWVYIYGSSSLRLGESVQEYCVEVPRTIGGSWGLTKEECFEVNVPEQIISRALAGGGSKEIYFSTSELKQSSQVLINAESLPEPDSLNQIQENYVLFESKNLEVVLR